MTASGRPRVSWLIPVYNGETFLREALDSVFAQTFRDFEAVVVNDGSTDSTRSILSEYEAIEPRLKVIDQSNSGIVGALNAGLAQCRGEYVARMDADDISLPNRLSFQVAHLDSNPNCVLVGGFAVSAGPDGKPARRTTGGRHRTTDLTVFPPRVAVSIHPLITVRRAALEEIGGYRNAFPHAEDYDLFLRLAELGTIDNPPEDQLIYRRHENAISIRHTEQQETSAALAEQEAIGRAGHAQIPSAMMQRYVRLRIFRRYVQLDPAVAQTLSPPLMRDVVSLIPLCPIDRRARRLSAVIVASLLRHARRRYAGKLAPLFATFLGQRSLAGVR